jgi:8-oxo-dGTP diphosphatase
MKSVKLVTTKKNGAVLLVRRRSDGLWTFPGGKRKRASESVENCLKRELAEELPNCACASIGPGQNSKARMGVAGAR